MIWKKIINNVYGIDGGDIIDLYWLNEDGEIKNIL